MTIQSLIWFPSCAIFNTLLATSKMDCQKAAGKKSGRRREGERGDAGKATRQRKQQTLVMRNRRNRHTRADLWLGSVISPQCQSSRSAVAQLPSSFPPPVARGGLSPRSLGRGGAARRGGVRGGRTGPHPPPPRPPCPPPGNAIACAWGGNATCGVTIEPT